MPKKQTFAERVRAAREKAGISRSQASKKWGLNYRTIESWEQGRSNPAGLYLEKLEAILKKEGV